MALKPIQYIAYPDFRLGEFAFTIGPRTINAADESIAWIGQAPVTDSLKFVRFWIEAHTTAADLEVRIETVSNGLPSGTLIAAGAEGTVTSTGTGIHTATITTPPALSRGDIFAIVIKQPSSNFGDCQIRTLVTDSTQGFPLTALDVNGNGWLRLGNDASIAAVALWADAGIVSAGLTQFVCEELETVTLNTGTDPSEFGNKFTLGIAVSVAGVVLRTGNGSTSGDIKITLYDSDDTVLAQVTLPDALVRDVDLAVNTVLFEESVVLVANESYRLTIQSTSTSDVATFAVDTNAGDLGAILTAGTVGATERAGSGEWTDSITKLAYIGLLKDKAEDGGGRIIGR